MKCEWCGRSMGLLWTFVTAFRCFTNNFDALDYVCHKRCRRLYFHFMENV